ncbi:nicotinamide riboside transporter PnuC [Neptunicella marina]|uniref:nicotinamide riboside transporter PnuC n=1 Tax=Neptunicella marina TaxID=2125989 RepID=UPI0030CA3122
MSDFLAGFAGATPIEWIATVAGFLCVYLLIRRSIWCFAAGLVQVSLYTYIFYQSKLYSDTILQIFYIGFQFYGWWIWSKSTDDKGHIDVDAGSATLYLISSVVIILSSAGLGYIMANHTDASFPYADAFTTCASLVAQWLLSYKKLLNWLVWIVVDLVAIVIYWQKGLHPTSVLYGCFLLMSIIGQWQWWQNLQQNRVKTEVTV